MLATTQPQRAESRPRYAFIWMATRLLRISALASLSSSTLYMFAYAITGMLTVMPWLPLPLLDIAGRVHPAMRASAAAAVMPMA